MNDPDHAYDTLIQTIFILIYPKKNQINFFNKINVLIQLDAKTIPLEAQKSKPILVQSQKRCEICSKLTIKTPERRY